VKHRITDPEGRGVELDDTDPRHLAWARKALRNWPERRREPDPSLRSGLEHFIVCAHAALGETE
jgi:hypothetical protein